MLLVTTTQCKLSEFNQNTPTQHTYFDFSSVCCVGPLSKLSIYQ